MSQDKLNNCKCFRVTVEGSDGSPLELFDTCNKKLVRDYQNGVSLPRYHIVFIHNK